MILTRSRSRPCPGCPGRRGGPLSPARVLVLGVLLLLGACAATGPDGEDSPRTGAPALPWDDYAAAAADGADVWRLDAGASRLWIFVSRAGPLARLGHDHVIAAAGLEGALRVPPDDWTAARGELHLPLARLAVDPAAVRDALAPGLGPAPPADDIAGTRENLLGPDLLDAETYPRIVVRLRGLSGTPSRPLARLEVAIRGARHDLELPVRLELADDALTVSGLAALRHQALGLEPFTALGGALRVAETLVVDFQLRYRPLSGDGEGGGAGA